MSDEPGAAIEAEPPEERGPEGSRDTGPEESTDDEASVGPSHTKGTARGEDVC